MKIPTRPALLVILAAFFTAQAAAESNAADAAVAAPDAAQASDEAAPAKPDANDEKVVGVVKVKQAREDGMVCRLEKPTGSHYPKQICRTVAEMAKDRADAMRDIRNTELRRRNERSTRLGTGQSLQRYKDSRGGR